MATTVSVTPDQITATSPAHLAATVPITVSTPNGTAGGVQFTYLPRADLATGVSPSTTLPGRADPPTLPESPHGPRPANAGQAPPTATPDLMPPVWLVIQQAILRMIGLLGW